MERPIIMLNTDNMPYFAAISVQIQSVQSISQRLMSAAGRVPCSY